LTSSLAAALSLTLTIPMSAIADIFVNQVDLTVTEEIASDVTHVHNSAQFVSEKLFSKLNFV